MKWNDVTYALDEESGCKTQARFHLRNTSIKTKSNTSQDILSGESH